MASRGNGKKLNASEDSSSVTLLTFLAPGIDRAAFIAHWLSDRNIPCTAVTLAGKKHLVVRFGPAAYDSSCRMKILVAHYDRAENTPGANDNSAACFQLMQFAERLASREKHNIKIIFTDGEEAAGISGIRGQGSYALGEGFRKLGMDTDDVFVFDACGRGDTLVLSTSASAFEGSSENPVGPAGFGVRLGELHKRALDIASIACAENWIRLPTPYSDDAGFIASGIPAQVFTILPEGEAKALDAAVRETVANRAEIVAEILAEITRNRRLPESSPMRKIIPATWQLMHTAGDTAATLNAGAFTLISNVLDAIARCHDAV